MRGACQDESVQNIKRLALSALVTNRSDQLKAQRNCVVFDPEKSLVLSVNTCLCGEVSLLRSLVLFIGTQTWK